MIRTYKPIFLLFNENESLTNPPKKQPISQYDMSVCLPLHTFLYTFLPLVYPPFQRCWPKFFFQINPNIGGTSTPPPIFPTLQASRQRHPSSSGWVMKCFATSLPLLSPQNICPRTKQRVRMDQSWKRISNGEILKEELKKKSENRTIDALDYLNYLYYCNICITVWHCICITV